MFWSVIACSLWLTSLSLVFKYLILAYHFANLCTTVLSTTVGDKMVQHFSTFASVGLWLVVVGRVV